MQTERGRKVARRPRPGRQLELRNAGAVTYRLAVGSASSARYMAPRHETPSVP